ncbi:MAG: PAS domain S-box protein, partial [Desulfobacterales bacterium]|nr:PAS domain S-box protein [Desulfobacterales bacterium]
MILLRKQAEEKVVVDDILNMEPISSEDYKKLIHELRLQKIELELQNDELRRSEESLESLRMKYFDLYNMAPVGYCTVNEKKLIIEVNLTAANMLGVNRKSILNKSITRFIIKDDQDIYYMHWKELLNTGQSQMTELRMVKKGGEPFFVMMSSNSIDIFGSRVFNIVISDITEKKRLEFILKENEKREITELKRMDERKRDENALRESELNFRTFFETIDDMIVIATHDGNILFTNTVVERKMGYSRTELESMHLLDFHAANDREEAKKIVAAMLQGKQKNCNLSVITKNGYLLPVDTRIWISQWNGVDCIFGLIKDLSVELEAKQLFERIFLCNPNPLALNRIEDWSFIDVNHAFLRTLGYSREEIIGKSIADIDIIQDQEEQMKLAEKLVQDGHFHDAELQCRSKDGRMIDGLFSGEIISNQGKKYFLTVMLDITELKNAERQLIHRAAFANLIANMSLAFLGVEDAAMNDLLDESLHLIGEFIGADRVYLFPCNSMEMIIQPHYWCAEGVPSQKEHFLEFSIALASYIKTLNINTTINIPDVSILPDSMYSIRTILERKNIKSLLVFPILAGNKQIAFLGFDLLKKQSKWTDEDQSLLQVFANNIGLSIKRLEQNHELRLKKEEW